MASIHEIAHTCPICSGETLQHVHCSNVSCSFVVTTCSRCDRKQAVEAFVADHEKDCVYGPNVVSDVSPPVFVAPRRAA